MSSGINHDAQYQACQQTWKKDKKMRIYIYKSQKQQKHILCLLLFHNCVSLKGRNDLIIL